MKPADLVPRPEWYPDRPRGGWLSLRLGMWLGITFTACFVTGLVSHFHQHPGPIQLPAGPVWAYAVSQGIHVTSGIASIPLLAVKLWSVAPRFWQRPLVGGVLRMLERGSVLVLVASAVFELVTGLLNVAGWYAFGFYFPPVHYAVAWLAIGAIAVHVAVQLPKVRALWGQPEPPVATGELNRRDVFRLAGLGAVVAAVTTAGDKLPVLRPVGLLSQRSGAGPQGLPVNRSAVAAGVAFDPDWQLRLLDRGAERVLSLRELQAMPQHSALLPIACVEGWNAWAVWEGVRLSELIADPAHVVEVTVRSPDPGGYGASRVSTRTLNHPDTLLALRLNGEQLSLDHGFPARLIAPNRPGAMQTKWVTTLEVRR
ncbi:MAG: molybdopterin-dependent oxidoreductase [Propionibacteriaceae bacterium]|nr:molybdopterin-dependent oxidoreductase [Propionibacteriaceae bacterium]